MANMQQLTRKYAFTDLPKLIITEDSPTEDLLEFYLRVQYAEKTNFDGDFGVVIKRLLERAWFLHPGRCFALSVEDVVDGRVVLDAYAAAIFKDERGNVGYSNWGEVVYKAPLRPVLPSFDNDKEQSTEQLMERLLRAESDGRENDQATAFLKKRVELRAEKLADHRILSLRAFPFGGRMHFFKKDVPQIATIAERGPFLSNRPRLCTIEITCDRAERVSIYQKPKFMANAREAQIIERIEKVDLKYILNRIFISIQSPFKRERSTGEIYIDSCRADSYRDQ